MKSRRQLYARIYGREGWSCEPLDELWSDIIFSSSLQSVLPVHVHEDGVCVLSVDLEI